MNKKCRLYYCYRTLSVTEGTDDGDSGYQQCRRYSVTLNNSPKTLSQASTEPREEAQSSDPQFCCHSNARQCNHYHITNTWPINISIYGGGDNSTEQARQILQSLGENIRFSTGPEPSPHQDTSESIEVLDEVIEMPKNDRDDIKHRGSVRYACSMHYLTYTKIRQTVY